MIETVLSIGLPIIFGLICIGFLSVVIVLIFGIIMFVWGIISDLFFLAERAVGNHARSNRGDRGGGCADSFRIRFDISDRI